MPRHGQDDLVGPPAGQECPDPIGLAAAEHLGQTRFEGVDQGGPFEGVPTLCHGGKPGAVEAQPEQELTGRLGDDGICHLNKK